MFPYNTILQQNVQRKKVSPFISGFFSKTYEFFWKFQLEKDITFLVAFYILTADRLKEEVSPDTEKIWTGSALSLQLLAAFYSEACCPMQLSILLSHLFLLLFVFIL